jgi:hypothetical protein
VTSESASAHRSCQRLGGDPLPESIVRPIGQGGLQERFQKAEQSLGAVQRDDVATVLDEVADEVVGEWS